MSEATLFPVGTNSSLTGIPGLDSSSYTAQRLKHASPEHLHLTTHRFFIGPIPEGWLNSHRKSWYKRRLELNNYSSRQATFDAAASDGHHRTMSGLGGPSIAARMNFSFPQPDDVFDDERFPGTEEQVENGDDNAVDEEVHEVAPVSEDAVQETTGTDGAEDVPGPLRRERLDVLKSNRGMQSRESVQRAESWRTAQETQSKDHLETQLQEQLPEPENTSDLRRSTSTQNQTNSLSLKAAPDNIDSSSKTALLHSESPVPSPVLTPKESQPELKRAMTKNAPAPISTSASPEAKRKKPPGVRFKVAEGVANKQYRMSGRVGNARSRVAGKFSRRDALREGTIIKMEKMLVRIDMTMQQLPDNFDENESFKTETRSLEKWREFMVVARKNKKDDEDDYRLQMYKTRVIPEIDTDSTKKKPTREIRLLHKSTHVNLFSSLDKTVVIWHPYRKGTRIIIMRPSSTAHSVEWYTFLRDALGLQRPSVLQVNVPDLDVALHLERPFDELNPAAIEAADEETAIAKAAAAERAASGRIIKQSMDMLEGDPEWTEVLKTWTESAKMGLAWKRYDRLEWIYGVNEHKMYGSMAMQHTHDLELRPKHHYPTNTIGKKGVHHEEPSPIEGFLIRLTSQRGIHKRLGKAFFKRLYFSTQNQYLLFNRPAKATPPHPPRLATIGGSNIPTSSEIVEKTPTMYDIEPFKVENGQVKWLKPNQESSLRQHDAEASEEARRNVANVTESDGYLDMCDIVKVRKIKWGATEADEHLDSGSDVDFHADVPDSTADDGTTTEIDDDRIFELVLENQLVVRLQAYSKETRDEWIRRLSKLVKYWKLRAAADTHNLKAVRQANLKHLNIDEEMEARIGQFARKWEVSRSEANPEIYNMCRLASCRTVTMSGMLYRKPRRHSTFQRCSVFLTGGQMLIYQGTLRKNTGEQIPHIHQEKQQIVDLTDCYVYSGLIVDDDLLYRNRTFDANHSGLLAPTPRIYPEDGWTSADVDVMTCFVVWMNRKKGWFRSVSAPKTDSNDKDANKSKVKRVTQLGVPGRAMVFKCRSRAERDLWVLSLSAEIEAAVEQQLLAMGKAKDEDLADVRLEH